MMPPIFSMLDPTSISHDVTRGVPLDIGDDVYWVSGTEKDDAGKTVRINSGRVYGIARDADNPTKYTAKCDVTGELCLIDAGHHPTGTNRDARTVAMGKAVSLITTDPEVNSVCIVEACGKHKVYHTSVTIRKTTGGEKPFNLSIMYHEGKE